MEPPKKIDLEEFLRISRMGVWRIEVEEGNSPRFYADEMMDKLLKTIAQALNFRS